MMKPKTIRAYLWAMAESGSREIFGAVFFLILTHVLSARDWGQFALAVVFVEFARAFFGDSAGEVLVQRSRLIRRHVDTLFWALLTAACLLLALLDAIALPLARLFHAPGIAPLLWALSATTLIGALGTVPLALLRRRMNFRPLANRQIIAHVSSGAVTTLAAFLGWQAWSFVAGQAVATTISTVLIWRAVKWRPRAQFSGRALADMWPYLRSTMMIRLMQGAREQLDKLVVGALFGVQILGFYAVAGRVAGILSLGILGAFNQVNLAALSKTQSVPSMFAERFFTLQTFTALCLWPAYIALMTNGNEAVSVILGSSWQAAGRLLPALAISGCCAVVLDTHGVALRSSGRPAWAFVIQTISVLVDFALMVGLGRLGIQVLVSVIAAKNIAAAAAVAVVGQAALGMRIRTYVSQLLPVALACAAMALVCFAVDLALANSGAALRVASSLAAGMLVYAALSAVTFRKRLLRFRASYPGATANPDLIG